MPILLGLKHRGESDSILPFQKYLVSYAQKYNTYKSYQRDKSLFFDHKLKLKSMTFWLL